MINRTIARRSTPALLAVALAAAAGAGAQSDQTVTTTREKPVPAPAYPPEALANVRLSNQPRYFLDTIDNLNRVTTDESRKAPGLAKNNYVVQMFPIRNARAIEIQSYLLRPLAFEGGTAEVMGAEGVKDADGNPVQYLFVTAPDFMMPGIAELVAACDRPGFKFFDATGLDFGSGPGAVRYVAKHRTASELTRILAGTELGNIGAFLFPPFADDSTNSIYIVDNPTDIADNLAALAMFDQPPLQLELEVIAYEIEEGNRAKVGLDWDFWKGALVGSVDYEMPGDGDNPFDPNKDVFSSALSLDASSFANFLNYTSQRGSSKVLTSTRITVVNSEDVPGGGARSTATTAPAVISATTTIPYFNAPSGEESLDTTFEGIRVEILPFIGTESITLKINAIVNSQVGFSKAKDIPLIATSSVNTVVALKGDAPLILGGLNKQTVVDSRVGIPLLKDIPVIQYLFSKESTGRTRSEVILVLKPRLKGTDDDATSGAVPTFEDILPKSAE